MLYWLVGPCMAAHGFWSGARRGRLRTRLDAEGAAALEPAPG